MIKMVACGNVEFSSRALIYVYRKENSRENIQYSNVRGISSNSDNIILEWTSNENGFYFAKGKLWLLEKYQTERKITIPDSGERNFY